jgi:hypothetical protein
MQLRGQWQWHLGSIRMQLIEAVGVLQKRTYHQENKPLNIFKKMKSFKKLLKIHVKNIILIKFIH